MREPSAPLRRIAHWAAGAAAMGGARTAGRVSESVPVMSTESSPESELSEPVEGETGRAIDFE